MLRLIIYIVLIVLALSFFGITIQSIVHSPAGQANFSYVWDLVVSAFYFMVNLFEGGIVWFLHLIHLA